MSFIPQLDMKLNGCLFYSSKIYKHEMAQSIHLCPNTFLLVFDKFELNRHEYVIIRRSIPDFVIDP